MRNKRTLLIILGVIIILMIYSAKNIDTSREMIQEIEDTETLGYSLQEKEHSVYVSCSSRYSEHIRHTHTCSGYEVCYIGELGVPEFVIYTLTEDMAIAAEKASNRTDDFRKCEIVEKTATVVSMPGDYRKSGFDKGHMCPNNDMDFSKESASETFYMCNMTPQYHALNAGVWKKTEELGHKYAKRFGEVTIVTGPVFENDDTSARIRQRIAIPSAFFKIFYKDGEAFEAYLIPNLNKGLHGLNAYKTDVRTIEEKTGLKLKK